MADYTLLDDEKLAALSKENDDKAFSELTKRYIPIAKYHASLYSGAGIETEDLSQEGMLGFITAVYAYEKEKTVSFATFATKCIKNRIISCVRLSLSKKRVPRSLTVSLQEDEISLGIAASPEESLIFQNELNLLALIIKEQLSEKEQRIFRLFLSGLSYKQIAETEGVTPKSVDGTMQRIRKKLRLRLS